MKRELALALEDQSQFSESLGRTRGATHSDIEASNSPNGSCKRFNGYVVNGLVVYTRERKSRINWCNEFSGKQDVEKLSSLGELEIDEKSSVQEGLVGGELQTLFVDKQNCSFESPTSQKESDCIAAKSPVKEGGAEQATIKIVEDDKVGKPLPGKAFRRFTRSALKHEVDPKEISVDASEVVKTEVLLIMDGETTGAASSQSNPKVKLEHRTLQKSACDKKPTTVKELFDTGLLEGVPVIYMGGKKGYDYGLRGTIKDGGILCTCSSCKGLKVIPHSQFEIHACKQYKRAAQYICLENGKSLLDLLGACRGSPLHMLEGTIQSVIDSSPAEKYFTCRRCKECFPSSCVEQIGPLCTSCVESQRLQCTPSLPSPSTPVISKRLRSTESVVISKSSKSTKLHIYSQRKSKGMMRTKSSKVVISKSSKSAPVNIRPQNQSVRKIKKRLSKPVSVSKSSKSASKCITSEIKSQWKITTKDQRLHKLVFEEGGLPDGTEVAYFARGQKLLQGYKKGYGILCCCCNCEVSPSQFEVHAGWSSRRKPYAYIYTSNGVSLHELAISLSKGRKYSAKDNDDLCIICLDGGNLLLCDGCPRAFHKECASLSSVPRGDWYCKFCQNMFQRERFVESNANAVAAGRVSGVDPIEQITKRCIRMVKNIENELSGCVLCRASDFSRSGFGPRTIILCDQCEKEYHVGCLKDHKMAFLKELPRGKWFCSTDCTRIHSALQKLLVRGDEKLQDSLLNVFKKKLEEKGLDVDNGIDIRWRLISGKIASPETRPLLSEVVAIFHDCFDPIVDATSGRDLIPAMVYGRNVGGQEFGGMYCAILIVNSSVVSAAMLRVYGQEIAELPLVATSNGNHGKGYFQILFSCIEKLLAFLNVKNLVLPAAEEAESIWTDKFSFQRIKPDQLSNYRRICYQMVTFKGTSMLQKTVPSCRVTNAQS